MIIIAIAVSILTITGAIAVLIQKSMLKAVITYGIVSLLATVLFVLMKAYDVAVTEASIGAVLTIAVFLLALKGIKKNLKRNDKDGEK
ncbi:MAG: DUF4040 domain-containing protein [Spirochaetales bacterium]|nr:DUF4040 domain-containing protein [Spirochaetales bacterium]